MQQPRSDTAPWTVKNVPPATKDKALRFATQADQTLGAWLSAAVDVMADRQTGAEVLPAVQGGHPVGYPALELAETMARTVAMLAQAGGCPPSRAIQRRVAALLDVGSREALGMPPRMVRVRVAAPALAGPAA